MAEQTTEQFKRQISAMSLVLSVGSGWLFVVNKFAAIAGPAESLFWGPGGVVLLPEYVEHGNTIAYRARSV